MAIDDLFQTTTDKVLDDRVARPLREPPAPRSFGASLWGVASAAPKGVGAGANESAGFFSDILGAYGEVQAGYARQLDPSLMLDANAADKARAEGSGARSRINSGDAFSTEMGTSFRATARSFAPDPGTAGTAEQLLFGLTRFATKAVGYSLAAGPVPGAVLTGADEGMTEADRLKGEGVDIGTRTKVGAIAGAVAGASVALPIAGTTLGRTAGLVAIGGPGGFIAQQAASKAILENAGYDKMADQYDPFDPVGLAVSTLVPAGFGAYALRGARARAANPAPADPAAARELSRMGGNERLALKYDDARLDAYAVTAAQREGIPPEALLAIKNVGERSGSTAVSPKGAKGVMQFMDDTWAAYGKGDPRDPTASIDAGARFMKDLIKQYDGDVRAAIAHYNGGGKAGKAVKEGRAAPAKETRDYLERTDTFIAERSGAEAGRAAAADPEMVAAARALQVRDAVADRGLHDPADVVAANEHLRAVQRAHDQLAAGERVDIADVISAERHDLARAYDAVWRDPTGDKFDPMVMIKPEDLEAVAISRGGWKGLGDIEVKGQGFGLVKFIWRHGEESRKPAEFQITRDDIMAFPQVIRDLEPTMIPRDDGTHYREWRAELPDHAGKTRSVVFVDKPIGDAGRHVVSAYIQEPGKGGADAPLSNKKTGLNPESPGKWADTRAGDTQPDLLSPTGQGKPVEASIADSKTAPSSPVAESVTAQADEIARLSPDMMVQLEGMAAPMRLADALEAVKAEAAREAQDAPLLQVAVECFLRSA